MFFRNREGAERKLRRQQAEDDAPRLADEVAPLRTLRLTLSYRRGDVPLVESTHVRIIVVSRAPALFRVACADHDCRDGGHDVTDSIMRALRRGDRHFADDDACQGTLGSAESRCMGTLHYEADATYG